MKKNNRVLFTFLMAAVLVFSPVSVSQASQSCPDIVPKVIVKSLTKRTKVFTNQSVTNLTMLHTGGVGGGGSVLGLHAGQFDMDAWAEYDLSEAGDRSCISLETIKIKFYTEPLLFVASNFPKGSCGYKVILEHEREHDRTVRDVQREYSKKAKEELTKFAKRFNASAPVSPGRVEEVKDRIQAQISSKVEVILREAVNDLNTRQRHVDSPRAYAKGNEDLWECFKKDQREAREKATITAKRRSLPKKPKNTKVFQLD